MKRFLIAAALLMFAATAIAVPADQRPAAVSHDEIALQVIGAWTSAPVDAPVYMGRGVIEDVFMAGADRLEALQNDDGGWDWPLDDGNPANASPKNTIGPIGKGLARAWTSTQDAGHLATLSDVGAFLLTKTNIFSPSDGYLAAQLDMLFGVTTYTDHMHTYFYTPLADSTYDKSGDGVLYNAETYVQLVSDSRHNGGIGNLAAWDIGMGVYGAISAGADASAWIAGTKAEIDMLVGATSYDVIGLAGSLFGLAYAGETFDPSAGQHAAASSLADLAVILASYQIDGAGFSWQSDYVIPGDDNETIQETAYSILALNEVNRALYIDEITGAGAYMISVQLVNGGWRNWTGGDENNEITAEALWGIEVASSEITDVWVDDDFDATTPGWGVTHFSSIQDGIDMVTGSTVNIAAGTYPGSILIPGGIPITMIGAGTTLTFLTGGMDLADGASGVTLQHFAISGEGAAGKVIHAGHPNHDFTMDHVLVDGESATYPTRIGYANGRTTGDVTITNCEFKNIGGWSVFDCSTSGYETVMGTVTFANNHIHECDGAVAFRGDNADRIDHALVYGNVWENINDNWNPPSTVDNAWACIEVHGVDLLEVYDNDFTNVNESKWGEGQGIQAWRVGTIDIHHNDFVDCWQGIWLPGLGTEPAPAGSIHDCNFDPITDWAVFATHGGGGFTSGILDARDNWWGHASGPYHSTLNSDGLGNDVSDHVLFEPWIGTSTLGITPVSSGPISCSGFENLVFNYTPDGSTPPLRGYTIRVTATSEVSFTESDITVHHPVAGSDYFDITMNAANDYTIDYALLGSTPGVVGANTFFDIDFHGSNPGAHSAATVSFVSATLRDLSNAPIGSDIAATASIDVDCLAPTVPTMSAEPTYTQGLSNTVSWSDESGSGAVSYYAEIAEDAGFTVGLGNTGWIGGLSNLFGGLADGQIYYYRVKSKDTFDNESIFSAAVFSTQDDTAPGTSVDALSTYQTNATFDVAWTGSDATSGLATVELWYSYESGAWTQFGTTFAASPISFTAVDGDGDYDFYTVGTDNVGNAEAAPGSGDATTQLDTTAPTGTFVINNDDLYTTVTGVTLNNAVTDATSGINQMRFRDGGGSWTAWEAYAATKGWTLPGPDGVNNVEAEFSDMAGNVFAISDGITLDTAAPGVVSDVDATPAHEEVVVTWTDPGDGDLLSVEIFRAVWHLTGGGNEQASAYPEYDDDNPAEPVRPTDYADAGTSLEWISLGTVPAGTGTFTDAIAARGIYYYELFAIDMASNPSDVAAANDRATNYHLGDMPAYDGLVDAGDITVLGAAYGTFHGDGDYDDEADVGPTDNTQGDGIPVTDNEIGFEDLMIFAMNYGNVAPLPAFPGSEFAHLSWFALEDGAWGLGLTEPCANMKALRIQAQLPDGVEVTLEGGGLLNQQSGPVFLRQIPGKGLDVSLAVMGEGVVLSGQGLLFSVTLPEGLLPTDMEIQVRDAANADLEFELSATEVADLPTSYRFAGNFPNPFNPKTSISFDLPQAQNVQLVVFSADGRRVVTLLDEQVAAGRHSIAWSGRDENGASVASGVYFARIQAGPLKETHKMLLLK